MKHIIATGPTLSCARQWRMLLMVCGISYLRVRRWREIKVGVVA